MPDAKYKPKQQNDFLRIAVDHVSESIVNASQKTHETLGTGRRIGYLDSNLTLNEGFVRMGIDCIMVLELVEFSL